MSVNDSVEKALTKARVIPVITVETADDAVAVCTALEAGGLGVAEVTFRTAAAIEALHAAVNALPDMLIGAGTVMRKGQVQAAKDAGAQFAISPGLNRAVLQHADDLGLYFIPGVMTPSDVDAAVEIGKRLLKFFPAEASGGVNMLDALHGPFGPLGVRFVPTGGVALENMRGYLEHPAVAAVAGSWLAPRKLIQNKDWASIEENARRVTEVLAQ